MTSRIGRSAGLTESLRTGFRNLLVLVRLHARDADRAHAFVLVRQRNAPLDQNARREVGKRRTLLHAVLKKLARPLGHSRGARLAQGYFSRNRWRTVHPQEAERKPAIIHDGDSDRPFVLGGFCLASGESFLHIGRGEAWFGAHRRSSNRIDEDRLGLAARKRVV